MVARALSLPPPQASVVGPWPPRLAAMVALALAFGCSSGSPLDGATQRDGGSEAVADAAADVAVDAQGAPGDTAETPAASALYDPERLLVVDIELPAADWDALRKQQRDMSNFLQPGCRDGPFESGFSYRKARVSVDGVALDHVGVRKKGFVGSMSESKPSLKLKFDAFTPGQLLHGVERMALNNNRQDRSFVRTCLAYQLFAQAGVPAPRCNFAHVRVNGESLGLYTHVETVKKRFLKRHFASAKGHLYEGTLSDFRPGWLATLEPKTSDTAPAHPALAQLSAALELPDDQLLPTLQQLLDLPAFLRFWAVEVLINHADGYSGNANNFFVYVAPDSGRVHFVPWGPDLAFVDHSFEGADAPSAVLCRSRLARRLYQHPQGQKQYLAALKSVADAVWDVQAIQSEIERMTQLIAPVVAHDVRTPNPALSVPKAVAAMQGWVAGRRQRIDAVLSAPPPWSYPEPERVCFTKTIQAKGTFKTTFGTQGAPNAFVTGTGTVVGSAPEGSFDVQSTGATSGYPENQPGKVAVTLVFQHPDDKQVYVVLSLLTDPANVQSGVSVALHGLLAGGGGFMATFHTVTKKVTPVAAVWSGQLTFEAASLTPGSKVEGTFETEWVALDGTP